MKVSAALSRSPVVTPGRTLLSSSLSVRTRMSPAAAILAISSGDLRMIKGGRSGGSRRGWPGEDQSRKDAGRRSGRSPPADRGRSETTSAAGQAWRDSPEGPLDLLFQLERGQRGPDVVVHLRGR